MRHHSSRRMIQRSTHLLRKQTLSQRFLFVLIFHLWSPSIIWLYESHFDCMSFSTFKILSWLQRSPLPIWCQLIFFFSILLDTLQFFSVTHRLLVYHFTRRSIVILHHRVVTGVFYASVFLHNLLHGILSENSSISNESLVFSLLSEAIEVSEYSPCNTEVQSYL